MIRTAPKIREMIRTGLEPELGTIRTDPEPGLEIQVLDTAQTIATRTIATEIPVLALESMTHMAPRRPEASHMAQAIGLARLEPDWAPTRAIRTIATEILALALESTTHTVPRPRGRTHMDPQTLATLVQMRTDPQILAPLAQIRTVLPETLAQEDMARLIATPTIPMVQEMPTQAVVHMDLATPLARILMGLVTPERLDLVTRSRVSSQLSPSKH